MAHAGKHAPARRGPWVDLLVIQHASVCNGLGGNWIPPVVRAQRVPSRRFKISAVEHLRQCACARGVSQRNGRAATAEQGERRAPRMRQAALQRAMMIRLAATLRQSDRANRACARSRSWGAVAQEYRAAQSAGASRRSRSSAPDTPSLPWQAHEYDDDVQAEARDQLIT